MKDQTIGLACVIHAHRSTKLGDELGNRQMTFGYSFIT